MIQYSFQQFVDETDSYGGSFAVSYPVIDVFSRERFYVLVNLRLTASNIPESVVSYRESIGPSVADDEPHS